MDICSSDIPTTYDVIMYMDGYRWMQMGAHGCTSVEEQEKEVRWGKRGCDDA